jgi:hypothetical protein
MHMRLAHAEPRTASCFQETFEMNRVIAQLPQQPINGVPR